MKLCPQCAFIYEDVQKVCDMDGQELVAAPRPAVTQSASLPVRVTVDLPPPKPRSKRIPLLAITGLLLVTLVAAFFAVQMNWRSRQAGLIADQSDLGVPPIALPTTSDSQAPMRSPTSDQSPANTSAEESTDDSTSSEPELSHSRSGLAAGNRLRSISSGSLSGSARNSVLIHLTNGGIVRADEAWERKDGVWYKQGGLVTLLPRRRVRSIERIGSAGPSQSGTNSAAQRNRELIAQSQPRAARTEVVTVKKESRVGSFLKKTGRILKKPFKF